MNEYKTLIDHFLKGTNSVDEFISAYFEKWKRDRDENVVYDDRFQRMIDRIFTSCDCYDPSPEGSFAISEQDLRDEIDLLAHIWWG